MNTREHISSHYRYVLAKDVFDLIVYSKFMPRSSMELQIAIAYYVW